MTGPLAAPASIAAAVQLAASEFQTAAMAVSLETAIAAVLVPVGPLAVAVAAALVPTAAVLLRPAKAVPLPPLGPVAVGRYDRPAHGRDLPKRRARGTTAGRDNARPNRPAERTRRPECQAEDRIR